MDLGAAGLVEQPFRTHGKPLAVISYSSERAALEMLQDTCENATGLSLLQGPSLSGKTTLIRTFVESLHEDCSVAVVDGKGLNTTKLLRAVLMQFGYDPDISSTNELLGLVRVFALQQAASHEPPLLIVENAHELDPSALRVLCELAELRVSSGNALKMVLVSDRSLNSITSAHAMKPIAKRILHDFHLRPMSQQETKHYLHSKLQAAGSNFPEFAFPDPVCKELWGASGGWPGIIDRIALLALARAVSLPVTVDAVERPALPAGTWDDLEQADEVHDADVPPKPPQLVVTGNGVVMDELCMDKQKMLIGRSEHNDISISSRFISRYHALLIRHGATTFLMDLNSTNGTFVNSIRVSNHVLKHDDVVTIGHHRIKFHDPYATAHRVVESVDLDDTVIMKTLDDMRNLLAQENTALIPSATEDLPILVP